MSEVKVFLVDDHTLVRAGIRALVNGIEGFTVCGEAASADAALGQLAELAATSVRPDIILTDISMPGTDGISALQPLQAAAPSARVLILSMYASDEFVETAFRHGASGYLLKDAAPAELEIALHAVLRGEVYLSPAVSRSLTERMFGQRPGSDRVPLTPRQSDILRLIASGKSTKEIAFDLGLSPKTVESHRTQIVERLGIRDVVGLARYARRIGLVSDF